MAGLGPIPRRPHSWARVQHPQERRGDPARPSETAGQTTKRKGRGHAGGTRVCLLCPGIHDLAPALGQRHAHPGVLSTAMADRTDLPAFEIDAPTRPRSETGRSKQPCLVIRKALRGSVKSEAELPVPLLGYGGLTP